MNFVPLIPNDVFSLLFAGWAFADSVLHRLAPLWVGARGLEFTWEYILQGIEANANLVPFFSFISCSLERVGVIFFFFFLIRNSVCTNLWSWYLTRSPLQVVVKQWNI